MYKVSSKYLPLAASISAIMALCLLNACSEKDNPLEPTPSQTLQSVSTFYIPEEDNTSGSRVIYVAIPKLKYLRKVEKGWASDAIQAILTPEMRSNLERKGLVKVKDWEIAEEIAIVAGMEGLTADAEVWIIIDTSWSCIKCGYAYPPCCEPWPQCCERDPKPGKQYGDEIR